MERAKAQGIPQKMWSRLQKGETMEHEGTDFDAGYGAGSQTRRGLSVTYSTDTRPVPVIAEYAKDNDLFICEGMYGEKEKAAKAREYKHMTFQEAARLGRGGCAQGDVADPLQPVPDQAGGLSGGESGRSSQGSKAARDGWSMELGFDEE